MRSANAQPEHSRCLRKLGEKCGGAHEVANSIRVTISREDGVSGGGWISHFHKSISLAIL